MPSVTNHTTSNIDMPSCISNDKSATLQNTVPQTSDTAPSKPSIDHRPVTKWWCGGVTARLQARLRAVGDVPLPPISSEFCESIHNVNSENIAVPCEYNVTDDQSHAPEQMFDRFVITADELVALDKVCKPNITFWCYNPTQSESLIRVAHQLDRPVVICIPMRTQWTAFTKGLSLLGQISKKTQILTQDIPNIPRSAPANMNVWYKPSRIDDDHSPLQIDTAETVTYDPVQVFVAATTLFSLVPDPSTTHTMQFAGSVSGIPALFLADSGAECRKPVPYINAKFCSFHNIKVDKSKSDTISGVSDNSSEEVVGTAMIRMTIGPYNEQIRCVVINMTEAFDVILSDQWLHSVNAQLDYGPRPHLTIKPHNRQFVLTPLALGRQRIPSSKPLAETKVLSYVGTKRAMRKGGEATLMLIKECQHESDSSNSVTNPDLMSAESVAQLIADYPTVFTDKLPYGGSNILLDEVIPTLPGTRPVNRPMFRYSPLELEEIERQVSELIGLGYIRPSASPWGAPVLLVKKPRSTELRMVVDFRAINALTTTNASPLPRIESLLNMVSGAKVFSTLDLSKAYHQCKLVDSDIPKTAFKTPFGHYEYVTLCFGLKNAPSRFQMMMNGIFRQYLNKFVLIYLDDIAILSKSAEEHDRHLRLVLDVLKHYSLTCNVNKCHLNKTELLYLGHIISAEGIKADPAKIKAIVAYPRPQDLRGLRSFLGMANYFRKFIARYSMIAKPLTDLLKKNTNVQAAWTDEAEKGFIKLKQALTEAPVLTVPDWTSKEPFTLVTDASYKGIGGILMQNDKVIAYESRKLIPAECNYSPTEIEMLAIDHCCKVFRCYIEGRKCFVYSDHEPNTTFPTMQMPTRRHARWLERLQGFDLEWKYIKGENNIADGLSRNPSVVGILINSMRITKQRMPAPSVMGDDNAFLQRVKDAYAKDKYLTPAKLKEYDHKDGLYYFEDRLVLPFDPDIINEVLIACHSASYSGHLGKTKTMFKARQYFLWRDMHASVRMFIKHCDCCQRNKNNTRLPYGLLQPNPIPSQNWSSVSMDFITKLPQTKSGHTAIFVVVDRLSKMCKIVPTYNTVTAQEVAKLFHDKVFCSFGMPDEFISDRDSKFTSTFWKALCKLLQVQSKMSTSFHPETDGQTERYNRTIQQVIRTSLTTEYPEWDDHLHLVEFVINNSYQESVKNTPFFLNYGRHPHIPISYLVKRHKHDKIPDPRKLTTKDYDAKEFVQKMQTLISQTQKAMQSAQARYKHYADMKRTDIDLMEGQMVMLSTKNLTLKDLGTKKFLPKFIGPFKINAVVNKVAYKLDLPDHYKIHDVFHVSLLKPYYPDSNAKSQPLPMLVNGSLEYEVEKIMDHRDKRRGRKTVREYRVRFKGYGPSEDLWLPVANLNCSGLLKQYKDSHPENQHSQNKSRKRGRPKAKPDAEPSTKKRK